MSAGEERINPPEKLSSQYDLSQFHCGEPTLDNRLSSRALQNEENSASRTLVTCIEKRVVEYYALALGALAHAKAPGRIRRNVPDPVPVMAIGRLAVDQPAQGQALGPAYCGTPYCVPYRQPRSLESAPSWCLPFQNA